MRPIEACEQAFLKGMHGLGVDVSRETLGRLHDYVELLRRWQSTINLVSRQTLAEVWVRHFLDSAQLVPLIPGDVRTLVDLGSGAGFPALVIAALRSDLAVSLVESDARKAAFLAEAARALGLATPPKLLIQRLESGPFQQAEIVTARAVAPLARLLRWADPYRSDTAICLFHKGKGWRQELTEAMKDWEIPYQSFTSVTDRDAVILRLGRYTATATDLRHRQPEGRRR